MVRMSWSGEAVDAAMLTAAVRVHRTVKANIWRTVACEDRPWVFNAYCSSPAMIAVERFDLIEPLAFCFALWQIEPGGRRIARCAAAMSRFDGHEADLFLSREHNKNKHPNGSVLIARDGAPRAVLIF